MTGALTSGLMSPEIRKVVDPWPRFVALLERYPLPAQRQLTDQYCTTPADPARSSDSGRCTRFPPQSLAHLESERQDHLCLPKTSSSRCWPASGVPHSICFWRDAQFVAAVRSFVSHVTYVSVPRVVPRGGGIDSMQRGEYEILGTPASSGRCRGRQSARSPATVAGVGAGTGRRPQSHMRNVLTGIPMRVANSYWVSPASRRRSRRTFMTCDHAMAAHSCKAILGMTGR